MATEFNKPKADSHKASVVVSKICLQIYADYHVGANSCQICPQGH